MEAPNLFAQTAPTPEPAIGRVRAELERFVADRSLVTEIDVARLADETVRRLWESRVKLFVPVLAVREARDRLLPGDAPARASDGAAPGAVIAGAELGTSASLMQRVIFSAPSLTVAGGSALGWPLGLSFGRPWLGVAIAGWASLSLVAWLTAHTGRRSRTG